MAADAPSETRPAGPGDAVPEEARWVVFGDDGSSSADVAWLWLTNHAWPGWRVSVVTARPPADGPVVGAARATPHPWEPESPRRLPGAEDSPPVEHLLAEADPRLVLDSFGDAGLMVIGARGTGPMKRLHIGSTAEWLVSAHRPLVPVVVVRSARPTRRVLLCVDGSDDARLAARTLAGMPWVGGASVTVLGVEDGRADAERAVAEAEELLKAAGVGSTSVLRRATIARTAAFDVRSTILEVIAEEQPDLVVTGTRGVGGIRRAFLGSTASALLHHAPCSVLVARDTDAHPDARSGAAAPSSRGTA